MNAILSESCAHVAAHYKNICFSCTIFFTVQLCKLQWAVSPVANRRVHDWVPRPPRTCYNNGEQSAPRSPSPHVLLDFTAFVLQLEINRRATLPAIAERRISN